MINNYRFTVQITFTSYNRGNGFGMIGINTKQTLVFIVYFKYLT